MGGWAFQLSPRWGSEDTLQALLEKPEYLLRGVVCCVYFYETQFFICKIFLQLSKSDFRLLRVQFIRHLGEEVIGERASVFFFLK